MENVIQSPWPFETRDLSLLEHAWVGLSPGFHFYPEFACLLL